MNWKSLDEYLAEYEEFHRPVNLPVVKRLECFEDDTLRACVSNAFQVQQPAYVGEFNGEEIRKITDSKIEHRLRPHRNFTKEIRVLELEKDYSPSLRENSKIISDIATNYPPEIQTYKEKYQHHFAQLVKALFREFHNNPVSSSDKICIIIPLRSGRFVASVGLGKRYERESVLVESKRIPLGADSFIVGLSEVSASYLKNCDIVLFCDSGVVSGITLMTFLKLMHDLDLLPPFVLVYSAHASWYGIINILSAAKSLATNLSLCCSITSFCINKNLRAVDDIFLGNKNKRERIVTGDVGDYLSPILLQ